MLMAQGSPCDVWVPTASPRSSWEYITTCQKGLSIWSKCLCELLLSCPLIYFVHTEKTYQIQNILTDFQLLPDSSSEILANKSKCAIFVRIISFNTRLQSWKIFPPYLFLWSICFQCDWIFFFSSSSRLSWFPCWQITHHSYKNPHFDAWIPARRKIFLISRIFWSVNT